MPNTARTSRPGKEVQTERLLESAMILFSRRGAESVSVAEICESAGLSRDTFYRCFSDKNELLLRLYSSNMAIHIERAQSLIDKRDMGIEGMQEFIGDGVDYLIEMGPLALTLMIDARRIDSPARAIIEQGKMVITDFITRWAEDTFSVVPQRELIETSMASMEFVLQKTLESEDFSIENIRKTKDITWKLVCGIFLVEACQNNKVLLETVNDESGGAITSSIEMIARTLKENTK